MIVSSCSVLRRTCKAALLLHVSYLLQVGMTDKRVQTMIQFGISECMLCTVREISPSQVLTLSQRIESMPLAQRCALEFGPFKEYLMAI